MYSFGLNDKTWSKIEYAKSNDKAAIETPETRCVFAYAYRDAPHDKLLVQGGYSGSSNYLSDFLEFSFGSSTWKRVTIHIASQLQSPTLCQHTATMAGKNRMVWYGGKSLSTSSNFIYCYDFASCSLTTVKGPPNTFSIIEPAIGYHESTGKLLLFNGDTSGDTKPILAIVELGKDKSTVLQLKMFAQCMNKQRCNIVVQFSAST